MYFFKLSIAILNLGCYLINSLAEDEYTFSNETYGITWMYFPNGDDIPEIIYLTEPPQSRTIPDMEPDIEIELYTRENQNNPRIFQFSGREKRTIWQDIDSYFNPALETKVIVHGWKSSTKSDTVQNIKNEYLKNRECNVFAVNWEARAANIYYMVPAKDTRNIGRVIANFLDYIISEKSADPSRIHLIGHSLGAHTVGYAGSFVKSGRIARITGLDPALPGFEYISGPESRLDPTDAEFVDIIHTCGGVLGYFGTLGHVDFYPNSGRPAQPGCEGVMAMLQACSHGRSHRFFAESINTETGFSSLECPTWDLFSRGECNNNANTLMGDKLTTDTRGVYYLLTRSTPPFAFGD